MKRKFEEVKKAFEKAHLEFQNECVAILKQCVEESENFECGFQTLTINHPYYDDEGDEPYMFINKVCFNQNKELIFFFDEDEDTIAELDNINVETLSIIVDSVLARKEKEANSINIWI